MAPEDRSRPGFRSRLAEGLALPALVLAACAGAQESSLRVPLLPGPDGASSLLAAEESDPLGFQWALHAEHNSFEADVKITATAFGLTYYTSRIPRYKGTIYLQPVLRRASWWTLMVGPATIETDTEQLEGLYCRGEAVAMSEKGVGARIRYERAESDEHEAELLTTSFSLLFDYTRGGRVELMFADEDADLVIDIPLIGPVTFGTNHIRYGLRWSHIWTPSSGTLSLDYAWTQRQTDVSAPEVNRRHELVFKMYPTKKFGFSIHGALDRGDLDESDSLGVGVYADIEQVGVAVIYSNVNKLDPAEDDMTQLVMALDLRF